MKCIKKAISILCILTIFATTPVFAYGSNDQKTFTQFQTNIPGIVDGMFTSDFWTNSNWDKVVMDNDQIDQYNKANINAGKPFEDIRNYPETLTKQELTDKIKSVSAQPTADRYDSNGNKITQAFYDDLKNNLNLDNIGDTNTVQYGISVIRTNMRTFPTTTPIFSSVDNYEFDRFQETAVYAIEPMAILSTSKDGQWYFGQMYNYLAWIPVKDVALTSKAELFNLVDTKNFLVVTGNSVRTNYNALCAGVSEVQLDMGVKVPLASSDEIDDKVFDQNPSGNYVVKLPTRNDQGQMIIQQGLIPIGQDVHVGYLPYTNNNIIKEVFKGLGLRYGWGGIFNGRDCSATVMDAYRTVGLNLSRNTGEQEKTAVGTSYSMAGMTRDERESLLDTLEPGTALYMRGHAMIYIGKYKGKHYMIHDFSGFYNNGKYLNSRELIVTPVEIGNNASGTVTYMDVLTSAKKFVLPDKHTALHHVNISIDNTSIEIKQTAQISITGLSKNNITVDLKNAQVEYYINDVDNGNALDSNNIAEVDKAGVIKAKKAGTAEVYVVVTLNGNKITSNKLIINVVPDTPKH